MEKRRRPLAVALPAVLLLLLSGCVPDVRTDYPREYEYAVSDEIQVYSIDDGSVLMTLTVTGARVTDETPQTWVYEYAESSGETVRRETAIRQVVEIACRYTGPSSSSAPRASHFSLTDGRGNTALPAEAKYGLPFPQEELIHLDDGGSEAVFRFGLKEAAASLLLTYRYGGGKITARIRLTPDGAAPQETTAAADTTTVGTDATESPPQESSEAFCPPEPAAPDTGTVSTAPRHNLFLNMCKAFFLGGLICLLGQDAREAEYQKKTAGLEAEYQKRLDELEPEFVDTITGIYGL